MLQSPSFASGWSDWSIPTSRSPDPPGGFALPPHVYVPGQTSRHPEDLFDAIKDSVTKEIAPEALDQTVAWKAGLAYLDAGYFWECHEVLEAVWMRAPEGSPEREMVQAVIQLANARLKLLMERPKATVRLCEMVEVHLARCPGEGAILGLRAEQVAAKVGRTKVQALERINAL
ncbi:MAG: DUF309 domain-containing protein [Sulfitobacter sp.]|nr:DUF309 domain-containing protein [Sulfitobacter sp.]